MKLIAYGKDAIEKASIQSDLESFLEVEVLGAIDLYSQRSEGEAIEVEGLEDDDLVELQDEEGYIRILSVRNLLNESEITRDRGANGAPLFVNDLVMLKDSSRGILKSKPPIIR